MCSPGDSSCWSCCRRWAARRSSLLAPCGCLGPARRAAWADKGLDLGARGTARPPPPAAAPARRPLPPAAPLFPSRNYVYGSAARAGHPGCQLQPPRRPEKRTSNSETAGVGGAGARTPAHAGPAPPSPAKRRCAPPKLLPGPQVRAAAASSPQPAERVFLKRPNKDVAVCNDGGRRSSWTLHGTYLCQGLSHIHSRQQPRTSGCCYSPIRRMRTRLRVKVLS
ncbi:formin-like protein 3 [Vulpes lagopus]|uniref:formin-like protein 3 n=1 Tax=Vulpes lagopus TaxID=494514 RepID=UPI001BCA506F|nr:formin-like protein 3 [Vulpes lagopus]